MDKMNNINACMPAEFIPSCEELVSFSGEEIENLVNENLRCNCNCNNQSSYNLRIKLFENCGNDRCECNRTINILTLDGLGEKYSYVDGTASIDNKCFDPDFKLRGVYTEICSNSDSRLLKLDVIDSKCSNDDCECVKNLKQGFNLSEIVKNIGDFDNLNRSCMRSMGDICINQKSYFINKCGKTYIVFKFNIRNNGNGLAQKILFSDVFPDNVFINTRCVFLNGCRICNRKICLDRNRMIIKLPDLDAGQEFSLMIVGVLCGNSMRENNFATISYVNGCFKCGNRTIVDIGQKNSNVKII